LVAAEEASAPPARVYASAPPHPSPLPRVTALASAPASTVAKETKGKEVELAGTQACALQGAGRVRAALVLHSACAAGVSGPTKARFSVTLPRPQAALQPLPAASCHRVKAHCSAAVTGVSDGLPVCVAVPLALLVGELVCELVAEAVAEREADRDPLLLDV